MDEKKKINALIVGLVLAFCGIVAFLVYKDEKKLNERINHFKTSVSNFFSKEKRQKTNN